MRRFGLGFYQDMGDIEDTNYAETVAARNLGLAAAAANRAGQDPTPLLVAELANAGSISNPNAAYASVSPSGSSTSKDDSSSAFDFAKDIFGSLVNAGTKVTPTVIQTFVPKKYAPIFGVQPPAPPAPKPASGPSTSTLLLVGGGLLVGGYLLTRRSGGGGTKTNPKGKKKGKHKGSSKKRKSSKRKGSRKSKGKKKGKR